MFWIATCAAVIVAVVLLREILLPFIAGLVLACSTRWPTGSSGSD
jgi:predicted PurR-regulated permease PerM